MKWRLSLVFTLVVLLSVLGASLALADGGFDEYGYNRTARIFVGPASGWCLERGEPANCLGIYSNDRLVMKWNAEWDRGNDEGWSDLNGYRAYLDNEWNGAFPGGSGEVWHYKIVWYGSCTEGTTLPEGGYCIWGQFQVLMDQGVADGVHYFLTRAVPNGYGFYP